MTLTQEISHSSLPPPEREVNIAGMANCTGGNHLCVLTSPFSMSYRGSPAGSEVAGKGAKEPIQHKRHCPKGISKLHTCTAEGSIGFWLQAEQLGPA